MNILITAFEPFGDDDINSSYELLKTLPEQIDNKILIRTVLPVVFDECSILIQSLINDVSPDAIMCLGQAGGDQSLRIEVVAINLNDARIPDNKGNQPIDEPIIQDGDVAYFSTLPTRKMFEALKKKEIPTRLSYSAGTYVCNNLMFHSLNMTKGTHIKTGFIHIPLSEQQVNDSSKPHLDTLTSKKGLIELIRVL
ncbi:MAG: pyroglutamyl-peptidase I [Clostridiales bacterium]|nr:pyroglutamyl-peptidase I [Clostridiales bacterium]